MTDSAPDPAHSKDLSEGKISGNESREASYRLTLLADKLWFRRVVFVSVLVGAIVYFGQFLDIVQWVLRESVINTPAAIITVISATAPVVLIIALLRVVFYDQETMKGGDISDAGLLPKLLSEILELLGRKHG